MFEHRRWFMVNVRRQCAGAALLCTVGLPVPAAAQSSADSTRFARAVLKANEDVLGGLLLISLMRNSIVTLTPEDSTSFKQLIEIRDGQVDAISGAVVELVASGISANARQRAKDWGAQVARAFVQIGVRPTGAQSSQAQDRLLLDQLRADLVGLALEAPTRIPHPYRALNVGLVGADPKPRPSNPFAEQVAPPRRPAQGARPPRRR